MELYHIYDEDEHVGNLFIGSSISVDNLWEGVTQWFDTKQQALDYIRRRVAPDFMLVRV